MKTFKQFVEHMNETVAYKLGNVPTLGKRNASKEEMEHTLNQYTPHQRAALRMKFGGRKITALYHEPQHDETTIHFDDKIAHVVKVGKRGKITPIRMMSLSKDPGEE